MANDDLTTCVAELLGRSRRLPAAYWLQIVLSLGIATLGLVLGSTAVVIGAMLVSPLMAPIVELGMGLAIGSPVLVLRAMTRVASSVVVVVGVSALIVRALPFQEVTGEISSRTSPTALDLGVAIFCAGAAAYTTIKPGSDTSATAAGTAIGIALVPPLCVIGFGFGSGSIRIASGAALLFTANFSAIVLFDALAFLLLGYGRVDVAALERAELERARDRAFVRAARALNGVFRSRYGRGLRVLTPLVLVGAVFFPLRQALREMAWQVSARAAVQRILAAEAQHTVRASVVVERHDVSVRLVIVGSAADAARMRSDLVKRIVAETGVKPVVNVLAVPDVATLRQTEPAAAAPPQPAEQLASIESCIGAVLDPRWPTSSAGELARWRLDPSAGNPEVQLVHLGAPLGAAATQMLATDLQACAGDKPVHVADHAFSLDESTAPASDESRWLVDVLPKIGRLKDEPSIRACVEVPSTTRDGGMGAIDTLRSALASLGNRVDVAETSRWSFRFTRTACPLPIALDGGVASDADSRTSDADAGVD